MIEKLERFSSKPLPDKFRMVGGKLLSFWRRYTRWLWPAYPVRLHNGLRIWTRSDVVGRDLRGNRELERAESLFVSRFLKPGMTVLDIGANIGYFTILASRQVGTRGIVVAFEPSPRERKWLTKNLVLNDCQNVRVEQSGASDKNGDMDLFVVLGEQTGCNSMRRPNVSEDVKRVTVPITTLDSYLSTHGMGLIDFVKMDIEGAELSALEGATTLLASGPRPVWLCELVDLRTAPWGYGAVEIYDYLARLGYSWFSVLPDGLLRHCARQDHFHENLVAVPQERLLEVQDLLETGSQLPW